MPFTPQFLKISVAFVDQGEIVPLRGETKKDVSQQAAFDARPQPDFSSATLSRAAARSRLSGRTPLSSSASIAYTQRARRSAFSIPGTSLPMADFKASRRNGENASAPKSKIGFIYIRLSVVKMCVYYTTTKRISDRLLCFCTGTFRRGVFSVQRSRCRGSS